MLYKITIMYVSDDLKQQNIFHLSSKKDYSSLSWTHRIFAPDFIDIGCKLCASKAINKKTNTLTVENFESIKAISYRDLNIVCVLAVTQKFPDETASLIAQIIIKKFKENFPEKYNKKITSDENLFFGFLEENWKLFSQEKTTDDLVDLNKNLEELKNEVRKNIEKTIARNDEINKIIEQSDHLSETAKKFYRTARNKNSCCGQ